MSFTLGASVLLLCSTFGLVYGGKFSLYTVLFFCFGLLK